MEQNGIQCLIVFLTIQRTLNDLKKTMTLIISVVCILLCVLYIGFTQEYIGKKPMEQPREIEYKQHLQSRTRQTCRHDNWKCCECLNEKK
jgi:hypothetical protein